MYFAPIANVWSFFNCFEVIINGFEDFLTGLEWHVIVICIRVLDFCCFLFYVAFVFLLEGGLGSFHAIHPRRTLCLACHVPSCHALSRRTLAWTTIFYTFKFDQPCCHLGLPCSFLIFWNKTLASCFLHLKTWFFNSEDMGTDHWLILEQNPN